MNDAYESAERLLERVQRGLTLDARRGFILLLVVFNAMFCLLFLLLSQNQELRGDLDAVRASATIAVVHNTVLKETIEGLQVTCLVAPSAEIPTLTSSISASETTRTRPYTPTPTNTSTSTLPPTFTNTPTASATPIYTPTSTPTNMPTHTPTPTNTPTHTSTPTYTPTHTSTPTNTPTSTPMPKPPAPEPDTPTPQPPTRPAILTPTRPA